MPRACVWRRQRADYSSQPTDRAIDGHLRANDAKYVEIPVERKYLHFSFESIISLTEINAYFLQVFFRLLSVNVCVCLVMCASSTTSYFIPSQWFAFDWMARFCLQIRQNELTRCGSFLQQLLSNENSRTFVCTWTNGPGNNFPFSIFHCVNCHASLSSISQQCICGCRGVCAFNIIIIESIWMKNHLALPPKPASDSPECSSVYFS